VVQVLTDTRKASRPSDRIGRFIAILAIVADALILFYLGWTIPSVGGSLVIPTVIVFGIGAAVAVVGSLVARARLHHQELGIFAVSSSIVAVLAAIWTFQFAMPFAIWSSNATAQAQAALSALQYSPLNTHGIVEGPPCTVRTTGSAGPLQAPYIECGTWTPEGHFVTFQEYGGQRGGAGGTLGYARPGLDIFPDQCVRQLFGDWSMSSGPSSNTPDPGSCPIGYHFQGGG
jgi:hypothetical protein